MKHLLPIGLFLIGFCSATIASAQTEAKPTAAAPKDASLTADNLKSLEELGVKHAKQGHCDKSIEALLPQADRISMPTFSILIRCLDIKKKTADLYRIMKSRSPEFKENSKMLIKLAQVTVEKGKAEDPIKQNTTNTEAIQLFRQAIAIETSNRNFYEALLKVFQDNNLKYETRELLHEMISKFGDQPSYLSQLCQREALDGYLMQARENCQKAIDKNPKDEKAKLAMVQVMFDQKDDEAALKLLNATATQFANNDEVQLYAGQVYFKKNDFAVAKRYLQKAVAINPNKASNQLLLGRTQVKLKEDQEALTHLIKACRLDSKTQNDFQLISSEVRQRGSKLADSFSSSSVSCGSTKSPASL